MKRPGTTTPTTTERQPAALRPRSIKRGPPQPRAAIDAEDLGDDDELPAGVIDPLALEPLSAAEVRQIETPVASMDEQREGALQILRKATEADLHTDVDDAHALGAGNDEVLEIRPGGKR